MTDTGLYFEDLIVLRNRAKAADLRNRIERSVHDEEIDFARREHFISTVNRADIEAVQDESNRWYGERPR